MLWVLINPFAGRGRGKNIGENICSELKARGIAFECVSTEFAGHTTVLAQRAVESGCKLLITVGGDGTAGEVAGVLKNTDTAMGLIPAGTGNDYGRLLGIPTNWRDALAIALGNGRRRVDLMDVNGRTCLNICSIGLDSSAGYYADKFKRVLRGMAAYAAGLVIAFVKYKPLEFTMRIDDGPEEKVSATIAVAANGQYYGGGFRAVPFADPSDGVLDLMLVDKLTRLKIIPLLIKYAKGRHTNLPICHFRACHKISISSKSGLFPVNWDGETDRGSEFEIELLPAAMSIAVPEA
ncbi:MAG: diacylglycerol kinase family lipid kinase [Clostridia bacterium]|nr:diacylglycerol kinase family lipid kinase [Clostridia bacterium]